MLAILQGSVGAFFGSFLQYLIEALILAAVAFCGLMLGKKVRANKDAKKAAENATLATEGTETTEK